ncbi:MAG TPA: orotidine-5'-phosphate decarboxylase [Firmicutes bacterium]|nr:orotidine-5'-phosphate decarboxylase [Bacillota bacterium]
MIDRLCERIKETGNPTVVGLDTAASYLPHRAELSDDFESLASAVTDFNRAIIERIRKIVPAVKVQIAYYEAMGVAGMRAFADTCEAARDAGMIVIADAKRNDIGATAGQYAEAFFGKAFYCDMLTVNGYLGTDGIAPFLAKKDKGIFVLVKTSNPSGGELQDMKLENGLTVYERMAQLTDEWGRDSIGKSGYSDVGAVVGATYPKQAAALRAMLPHTFFLVPGYGAQGGGADGAVAGFDEKGGGGIVNSSRGIICAYKQEKYKGMKFDEAAYAACVDMREDLTSALARR